MKGRTLSRLARVMRMRETEALTILGQLERDGLVRRLADGSWYPSRRLITDFPDLQWLPSFENTPDVVRRTG